MLRFVYKNHFHFQAENKWSEAAAENEEQAVNVLITEDMSKMDVVQKILEIVEG